MVRDVLPSRLASAAALNVGSARSRATSASATPTFAPTFTPTFEPPVSARSPYSVSASVMTPSMKSMNAAASISGSRDACSAL